MGSDVGCTNEGEDSFTKGRWLFINDSGLPPVSFFFTEKCKQVQKSSINLYLHIQSDTADMSTVSFTLSQDYGYVVQPPIPFPIGPIPISVPLRPQNPRCGATTTLRS